jgi:transposase
VGILAKIKQMYFRDELSIKEIAKWTNLSRDTVSGWLKKEERAKYRERRMARLIDPYIDQLRQWLETDSHQTNSQHQNK